MVRPTRFAAPGARPAARITQQAVDKAVLALMDAGERVTTDTVRAKLGSGSLTTVSKMLKEWERKKHERLSNGASLVGDEGASYLISKQFMTAGGREICSIVLNGLHLLIDKAEAQRIISATRALKANTPEAAVMPFGGEFVVSINLAGSLKFTAGMDFVERLASDLEAAGS